MVDHCIVCPFVLTIVLYVLLSWPLYCMSFCLDHCIVCPFFLIIVLYVLLSWYNAMVRTKGHTIQWSRQRDIQYNDHNKRTYNTMVKTKGHTIQWSRKKDILLTIVLYVLLSWSLYYMSFCLDHCIVCPFVLIIVLYVLLSWPLYCITIQWSQQKDIQYNGQDKRTYNTMVKIKGHTIQWSRQKDIQYNGQDKRTYNTMIKTKGHTITLLTSLFLMCVVYKRFFDFNVQWRKIYLFQHQYIGDCT
jgi:hypothetical protein